jgi:hypothetical protein
VIISLKATPFRKSSRHPFLLPSYPLHFLLCYFFNHPTFTLTPFLFLLFLSPAAHLCVESLEGEKPAINMLWFFVLSFPSLRISQRGGN